MYRLSLPSRDQQSTNIRKQSAVHFPWLRGFEAGGVDEVKMVKAFINKQVKMTNMADQLHAIWCEYTFNFCQEINQVGSITGVACLLTVSGPR